MASDNGCSKMGLIEKVIKEQILNLERVKDTFDDRFDYLRLDKNERLLPFTREHLQRFRDRITFEDLSGYGELGGIYRRLADFLEVGVDNIFFATGSDLAIKSIYESCVDRGDNVVLHGPCYAMERVYAQMFGAEARIMPVRADWTVDTEAMLKAVDGRTKLVLLENPNGFVGTKPSREEIAHCAAWLQERQVLLLVDECYLYVENHRSDVIPLLRDYKNIVISQSFSKGHGLAGVRCGFLVGDAALLSHISRVRPMHEITNLTALAVAWVLDNPGLLKEYQDAVHSAKVYLGEALRKLQIPCRDTHANFILLYLPDEGITAGITEALKDRKILVRRPFEEAYLRGWSRICVASLKEAEVLVAALTSILDKKNREGKTSS